MTPPRGRCDSGRAPAGVRADPALIHRSEDRKKNMQTTVAKPTSARQGQGGGPMMTHMMVARAPRPSTRVASDGRQRLQPNSARCPAPKNDVCHNYGVQ